MGITEHKNTKQIHFCFACNGPGPHRWRDKRVCLECRNLLLSLDEHRDVKKSNVSTLQKLKIRTKRRAKRKIHSDADKLLYRDLRSKFLEENPFCWVSLIVFKRFERSNVVHHRSGRRENYLNVATWLPTTREGDTWIHQNHDEARELGFLI